MEGFNGALESGVGASRLWIPGHASATNDEVGAGGIQAYLRPRNTIFVPIAHAGCCRRTKVSKIRVHWLTEGFRSRLCRHLSPGWGQAPALHFSFDSRQVPARQGSKIGCIG